MTSAPKGDLSQTFPPEPLDGSQTLQKVLTPQHTEAPAADGSIIASDRRDAIEHQGFRERQFDPLGLY